MNKKFLLNNLKDEISYRKERCQKVWDNKSKEKYFEFKSFILSLGSAMDLLRVHVFSDFEGNTRRKKSNKYFKDLYTVENSVKLNDNFKKWLENTFNTKARELENLLEKLGKIFFEKKYIGTKFMVDGKHFDLWTIYTKLKHASFPEQSHIYAIFNDIVGTSGDIMIKIYEEKNKEYEIHFPGKPVVPYGVTPEDFGISSKNQTLILIENISQNVNELIENLLSYIDD